MGRDVDRNLFYESADTGFFIDPKTLVLHFQGHNLGIFSYLNQENLPFGLLEHLKMEGEEHYYYKTTDGLMAYLGQYSQFILKNTPKHGYCLAPVDEEHIIEAQRPLYNTLLERDMVVMNMEGVIQPPVTAKNIIHFQLQPQRKAFDTFKTLVRKAPKKFPMLKQWIEMGTHEMLDLVSKDDEVIGVISRKEVYSRNMSNFRVVNVFLVNSKGELWIPTRSGFKTLFPNCLDCSVGGHVHSNETYLDAFYRETREEVNIDCKKHPFTLLRKLTPHEHGTSAFMEVYTIYYDGTVDFNKNDFTDGQWISPENLKALLKKGVPMKKDLKIIIEECFPDA